MVLLHFAWIRNNSLTGVSTVVPKHVIAQNVQETVGLINLNNEQIECLQGICPRGCEGSLQIPAPMPFRLESLPESFQHPDLAVFHECYRPDFLAIARHLRKRGVPYVICPHGELRKEAQRKKWLKKTAANVLLFNRFINGAAGIQLLSQAELTHTSLGKYRFVASSGIDLPNRQKEGFRQQGTVFLYIGRYEWRVKGLDLMMEAIGREAAFLREQKCCFSLYGPDVKGRLDQVRKLVQKNGVEDLVLLHERIQGKEKEDALLDADIFLQTSRHEGMPVGILEAMSYGLPCLVTEGTSLAKEIRDAKAGWTAGNRAEEIAAAIRHAVMERDEWKRYGENAIDYVRRYHDWNTSAAKTLESYSMLIDDRLSAAKER